MSDQFTPSVSEEVNPGPTLEQQAAEMGIEVDGAAAPAPETPDLILGKFKSNEDLAQAYQSLEQRMGQQSPDLSAPLTQASEYYAENGQLSDQHYDQLEQVGINRQFVDQYIAGQQAQTQQSTQSWYDRVGGEGNYQAMGEWMQTYLPDSEINAYNRVMESGTDEEVGVLMSGMFARYQAAMNQNYQQVQGQTTADEPLGFQSRGQVMEALNDPRYDYDESYRKEFEAKLAMTPENIF